MSGRPGIGTHQNMIFRLWHRTSFLTKSYKK
jgi:hypothetical protein